MKTNEAVLSRKKSKETSLLDHEEIGDNHLLTGMDTPMKPTAFLISDEEKKKRIAFHFTEIMEGPIVERASTPLVTPPFCKIHLFSNIDFSLA